MCIFIKWHSHYHHKTKTAISSFRKVLLQQLASVCTLNGYDYHPGCPFEIRMYDPAVESIPMFNSTVNLGNYGERGPSNTTGAIVHPLITTIQEDAISGC